MRQRQPKIIQPGCLKEICSQFLPEQLVDFETLKKEQWILGVDQAGRGPVLGPMFYAACYWPKRYNELIVKNCGFKDSKKLTEKQRDYLFGLIKELKGKILQYEFIMFSAEFLSIKQQAFVPENLNEISHGAALNLIKSAITKSYNIKECCIDTVGPKGTYRNFLSKELESVANEINIQVEEKADSTFPIVGAASICAKVIRDEQIQKIQANFRENSGQEIDLGSGYPFDQMTKNFMRKMSVPIFAYPKEVRFSWETTQTAMKQKQLVVEYFEEDNRKPTQDYVQSAFTAKQQRPVRYRQLAVQNIYL